MSLFPGGAAHPVEMIDPLAVRRTNRFDEIGISFLGLFRKVFLHEDAAENHAHRLVFRIQDTLPSWAWLLLSRENLMVKNEVFLIEILVQKRRILAHQVITHVVLQNRKRC